MATIDFRAILGKKKEDIEDPKILPEGTYLCQIAGRPEMGVSQQQKTPFARFTYNIVEAKEDVNPEELAASGGVSRRDGRPRQITRDDFYITEDSEFRLRDFINTWGIEWATFSEAFEQLDQNQVFVLIQVAHEMEDPEKAPDPENLRTFVRIKRRAKA